MTFREQARALGLSAAEVAARCGVSAATVCRCFAANRPPINHLAAKAWKGLFK